VLLEETMVVIKGGRRAHIENKEEIELWEFISTGPQTFKEKLNS